MFFCRGWDINFCGSSRNLFWGKGEVKRFGNQRKSCEKLLRGPVDGGTEEAFNETDLVDEEKAEGGADDSGDGREVAGGGFKMFSGDGYGNGHGGGHEHHAEDGAEAED